MQICNTNEDTNQEKFMKLHDRYIARVEKLTGTLEHISSLSSRDKMPAQERLDAIRRYAEAAISPSDI